MADQANTSTKKLISVTSFPGGNTKVDVMVDVVKSMITSYNLNHEKVIVVTVAGPSRSGKSFLMNLLIHYYKHCEAKVEEDWKNSNAPIRQIGWASGEKGVTKGIWICEKPLAVKRKDGGKVYILLVDTQGLGDDILSLNEKIDRLLLISSLQLSDLLIYNVRGATTSHDLRGLFSVLRSWDAIMQEKPLFNHLMFLYRDWQFTKILGLQPDLFKKKVEEIQAEANPAAHSAYKAVQEAFRHITSFTSPHPGEVIPLASEKDNLMLCDLGADCGFLDTIKYLLNMILGFEEDALYFESLVGNAQNGHEVLARFQTLKEWIGDEKNILKDEELEHVFFQNKVNVIFESWRKVADENLLAVIKEKKEYQVPAPQQFLRTFAQESARLNTLPMYSVYYKKLEDEILKATEFYKELLKEYLNCRNDREVQVFFQKWNEESSRFDPRTASILLNILGGIAAASLLAAGIAYFGGISAIVAIIAGVYSSLRAS